MLPHFVFAACTGSSPSWSSTPDYDSINACVQNAASNDVIFVSKGTGSVTWPNRISINKSLKIVGPGMDALTVDISSQGAFITSALTGVSISGFSFMTSNSDVTAIIVRGTGWRIYQNRFYSTSESINGVFVLATGADTTISPEGVVHNNVVTNGKIVVFGGGNFTNESLHWADPSTLGTANSVYIEDNIFNMTWNGGSNCVDANLAGRYVFRYNSVVQAYAMAHSLQGEGIRGTREWEIYGNTFNSFGNASYAAMYMRGGTGMLFLNDTTSSVDYNFSILFDNVRDTTAIGVGKLCDGNSIWDENSAGKSGWLCRDQIGAGKDAAQWYDYNTPGPSQTHSPVYIWGIYKNGLSQSPYVASTSSTHIENDRDYYTHKATFNGTSGVGCGTLAARPPTCTTGVGYWATNQSCTNIRSMIGKKPSTPIVGTLYKCVAPNTWTAYYTPYTYPHPLSNPQPPEAIQQPRRN